MAAEKKMEKSKEQKKAARSQKMLIFSMMVMGLAFLSTSLVLGVCMIPTLVAAMVDRQQPKTAWITVGAMNLAGALPSLFSFFEAGRSMPSAIQAITKPSVLAAAYGGAAVGLLIYNNVTPMVAGLVAGKNEKRLKDIDKRLRELIKKWGDDVKQ